MLVISSELYCDDKFKVVKSNNSYVLINRHGEYENHGHFKKYNTCLKLIQIMKKNIVPFNDYLRTSVLRISTDEKYIEKVKIKMEKDKEKEHYININKGAKTCR